MTEYIQTVCTCRPILIAWDIVFERGREHLRYAFQGVDVRDMLAKPHADSVIGREIRTARGEIVALTWYRKE